MAARHAHVETGHRLISTTNLHLVKGSLVAIAAVGRALDAALLCVVPGTRTTKDIFALWAGEFTARVDGIGDGVLVGACAAFEAVGAAVGQRDGEDVGAVRADCAVMC